MAQQNAMLTARIPVAHKEAGNTVLADLGYTPSDVINLLWAFIAAHKEDVSAVQNVISSMERGISTPGDDGLERMKASIEMRQSLWKQLGTENAPSFDGSYKELREQAFMEGWAD